MHIANDPIHRLCKVLYILRGQASNTDSTIISEVDVEAFLQGLALGLTQTSVGEHADLVDDVLPFAGSVHSDKFVIEGLAHGFDTGDHCGEVIHPFGVELRIIKDL